MPDVDPYVSPPRELVPARRLDRVRPWLWALIIVVLMGAAAAVPLIEAREDPTLQIPLDGTDGVPAAPDGDIPIPIPEPT